jgi:hypothetical protein
MGFNIDAEEADRLDVARRDRGGAVRPALPAGTASASSCRPTGKRAPE